MTVWSSYLLVMTLWSSNDSGLVILVLIVRSSYRCYDGGGGPKVLHKLGQCGLVALCLVWI